MHAITHCNGVFHALKQKGGSVMTVDEILATGKYTDRRGREWLRCPIECFLGSGWFCLSAMGSARKSGDWHPSESQMRLLIEREQHSDGGGCR